MNLNLVQDNYSISAKTGTVRGLHLGTPPHNQDNLWYRRHTELNRSYNIRGENEVRNIDLVRMICTILDDKRPKATPYADQITFVADRPGLDLRYAIDPARIAFELGWRPSVTLEQGLEKTVQWYLDNEDWWRALQTRNGVGTRLGTARLSAPVSRKRDLIRG